MLTAICSDPVTILTCLLVLAVAAVNGWTDAPNAIATAVCTGALSFRRAVCLAALCNLLGLMWVTAVNTAVAETLFSIAGFGADTQAARSALCGRAVRRCPVVHRCLAVRASPPARATVWPPPSPEPPWLCPAARCTPGPG